MLCQLIAGVAVQLSVETGCDRGDWACRRACNACHHKRRPTLPLNRLYRCCCTALQEMRTVYDEYNDEEIVMSKEEMRMIQRIRTGGQCGWAARWWAGGWVCRRVGGWVGGRAGRVGGRSVQ